MGRNGEEWKWGWDVIIQWDIISTICVHKFIVAFILGEDNLVLKCGVV